MTQPKSAFRREWSVTVHSSLLGECVAFDSSTLAQGAITQRINNVPGHNN